VSLRDTLHTLISARTNSETVIFADQNAPRPPLPYWTVRLSARRLLGRDAYSQGVDQDGMQLVSGVRELTLQVQRYGQASDVAVADLCDQLSLTTVLEEWQVAKLSLYDVGDVLDVAYKLDNAQLEPRASVDLFVRFGTELLDDVGWIDVVEVGSEYVTNQTLGFDEPNADLSETFNVVL